MQGIIVVQINNGDRKPETESREHLMLREIEEEVERLERISTEVSMRHAVLSKLRDTVREVLELSGKPGGNEKKEKSEKTGTQAGSETSPLTPGQETPNLTENEQLEILERGLRYAVGVLENTKMAYYFKTIKQLRENLVALVKTGNAPVPERIAELEAGLKYAIKVLGESTRASKSKVTRSLRENLVKLLGNKV